MFRCRAASNLRASRGTSHVNADNLHKLFLEVRHTYMGVGPDASWDFAIRIFQTRAVADRRAQECFGA